MKKMLVFIAILVMVLSVFSVNALVIKKVSWGFNTVTGRQIGGFPTPPFSSIDIKPVCKDTDASPDYALIGIPGPEVQKNNADLFIRAQATGVLQSNILPQITGEDANKCAQRFLDPSAGYATFMDCCSDSKTLTEAFCKGSTGPFSIQIPCRYGCKDGVCLSTPQVCTDTDGGKAYGVKGVTTAYDGYQQTDVCHNPSKTAECSGPNCYLSEYYCTEGQMVGEENHACPYGCKDGACVSAPAQNCTDSDASPDYGLIGLPAPDVQQNYADLFVRGKVTAVNMPNSLPQIVGEDANKCSQRFLDPSATYSTFMDCCADSNTLTESFCKGNTGPFSIQINCKYSCQDGACAAAPPGSSCTRVFKFANNEGIEYTLNLLVSPSSVRIMPSPTGIAGEILHFYEGKITANIAIPEYFVLTAKPSPRFTHIFRYTGFGGGQLKFTDLGTGNREIPFTNIGNNTGVASLVAGGKTYRIYVNTLTGNLLIDQNADGLTNGEQAEIVDNTGKAYNQEYFTENPCAVPVVPQPPVVEPQPPVVIPQPPVQQVSERVTCMFKGSRTDQKCYSSKGECSGKMFCVVAVTGARGEKVSWKSSCGGLAITTMDGRRESAVFACRR